MFCRHIVGDFSESTITGGFDLQPFEKIGKQSNSSINILKLYLVCSIHEKLNTNDFDDKEYKGSAVQHILYSTTPLENEQAGIKKVHFELFQQKIKEGRSL